MVRVSIVFSMRPVIAMRDQHRVARFLSVASGLSLSSV